MACSRSSKRKGIMLPIACSCSKHLEHQVSASGNNVNILVCIIELQWSETAWLRAGLLVCGDSTFPGIGVPAVAASGAIAANSLVPVWDHWKMLDRIGV